MSVNFPLKTDYVDDVLNTNVNTNRKFRMINNGDGTVSFEDVTEYLVEGDGYGKNQINEQNEAINEINNDLKSLVHYADVEVSLNATSWTNQATGIDTSAYDVIGWSFNYTDNIYTAIASGSAPSLTYNRTNNELTVYNPYAAPIALSVRVAYVAK